jgi:hypothetical protein
MSEFLNRLFDRHEDWRHIPVVDREADDWRGSGPTIPPPAGSDLAFPLVIEEAGGEITIYLDHSHVHMDWPPRTNSKAAKLWTDPLTMVDAILSERVVSRSGWIDDQLRVGSIQEVDRPSTLLVPNLQRIRVRSWKGTFDRDDAVTA